MEKNVIFSTRLDDEKTWRDSFVENCEENGLDPEEANFYEWFSEEISRWHDDEKANLNVTCGNIVALCDLGYWNGRRSCVLPLSRTNVNAIFDIENRFQGIDDVEFYCDEEDVCCALYHHDGTHYITFVEIVDMEIDDFMSLVNSGADVEKVLSEHTISLRPRVAKVYGW